ncbi:prepilin-type N-terminal cleavage/methylation domain-containing protein [Candidatus Sumerlaeota bacterium]|nr:prepilin-type N-terminal cleavage/methylation domain-containing protein [Candidatus Sumerlaeota bacterium]
MKSLFDLRKSLPGSKERGFTLIELLIVVLIIAILAAIAVPNFLEFQTRAKVSRVKADMRAAITALEAYFVDNNVYPNMTLYAEAGDWQSDRGGIYNATCLSSPIAYLSNTLLLDPFAPVAPGAEDEFMDMTFMGGWEVSRTFNYMNIEMLLAQGWFTPSAEGSYKYVLVSYGPDQARGPIPGIADPGLYHYADDPDGVISGNPLYDVAQYDPTNGTVSGGDIIRYQGRSSD